MFFFEKKNQKTFSNKVGKPMLPYAQGKINKVFCFFFSKKKSFYWRSTRPDKRSNRRRATPEGGGPAHRPARPSPQPPHLKHPLKPARRHRA